MDMFIKTVSVLDLATRAMLLVASRSVAWQSKHSKLYQLDRVVGTAIQLRPFELYTHIGIHCAHDRARAVVFIYNARAPSLH